MKKLNVLFLLVMIINSNLFGQTVAEPIEVPYFVVSRESTHVNLTKELGGKYVKGFAGIKITLNSSGKLLNTEVVKLKLSGKLTLSYQLGHEQKTKIVREYEVFLKKCVSQIKIIKTDDRKPPNLNNITFIIRF
jgi:hypothetical protein